MAARPRIIIIEDDASLLNLYEFKFRTGDFDVIKATDGTQGLSLTLDKKPDVVLLDIMLPKLDGLNLLKELRLTPGPVGRTPVVIMTALTDKMFAQEAMRLGANEYIIKSETLPNKVVEIVKRVLKK